MTEVTEPGNLAAAQASRWLDQVVIGEPVMDLRPDYTALVILADLTAAWERAAR